MLDTVGMVYVQCTDIMLELALMVDYRLTDRCGT